MGTFYTALASRIIFPLHERIKQHTSVAQRRALERSQFMSRSELLVLQQENLRRFFKRISVSVPWYASGWSSWNIDADRMTVEDLQKLPRLTKADIRNHVEQFKTTEPHQLRAFNTGGSSGQPLTFFLNERVSHDVAAKWRATRWWGVDIGDPELVLWGSPIELNAQDKVRVWRDKLLRSTLVPAFDLGPKGIQHFIDVYRQIKPRMLFGYPSAFARISQFATQQNISLKSSELRVCFVTAERLYDEQRALIEATFGVPVANGYGSRDAGFIAHQCPEGGMHVMAEDIVVEILRDDGRACAVGETGEITVTHLRTADFPFVRYRTGDQAVWSDAHCACGRGLPLLERIDGRSTDFVKAKDGTMMHGLALIYVVREHQNVEKFRVLQHSVDHTEVLIVSQSWTEAQSQKVIAGVKQRLGEKVSVTVTHCDDIPTEANGKFRFVVSRCH